MFIFPYFREHVIRQRIIIIRTGAIVTDVVTYHKVNQLAIIWNTTWNIFLNTYITFCDSVPISCIYMVYTKVINNFWCIVLWFIWNIFLIMSSFRFSVPAELLWALTVSSQFETITFLDGQFSIAANPLPKTALLCTTNDYIILFCFVFFSIFVFLLNEGIAKRRDVFIPLVLISYFSQRLSDKNKLFGKPLIPSSIPLI